MAAAAATTAQAFRKLVRNGKYTTHTCGLGIELGRYAQANLVILPSKEAKDFHQFCEFLASNLNLLFFPVFHYRGLQAQKQI